MCLNTHIANSQLQRPRCSDIPKMAVGLHLILDWLPFERTLHPLENLQEEETRNTCVNSNGAKRSQIIIKLAAIFSIGPSVDYRYRIPIIVFWIGARLFSFRPLVVGIPARIYSPIVGCPPFFFGGGWAYWKDKTMTWVVGKRKWRHHDIRL